MVSVLAREDLGKATATPQVNGHLAFTRTRTLLRTSAVEVVRLIVRAGQEITEHKSTGEVIVYCLEGRVTFTALGKTQGARSRVATGLARGRASLAQGDRGCLPPFDDHRPGTLTHKYPVCGITGPFIMLEKIISGGQSGADQAGWRAAKAFGISSGGWMPKGFLTEGGPRPEFADQYGAVEMPTENLRDRTDQNVLMADATLWIGVTTTSGAQETVDACLRFGKPCLPVYPGASFEPSHVATWILENKIGTLNVAGNRESDEPGIGERVERFLGEVLQQLDHERP